MGILAPCCDSRFFDSRIPIHAGREELTPEKQELLQYTNQANRSGNLDDVLQGADVFIGVSKGDLLNGSCIRSMSDMPITLAMDNPISEIMADMTRDAGQP